jgi:multidrug transporter EmrE-like cation transporter
MNPSMQLAFWLLIPYTMGSFCWLPALQLGQSLTRIGTAWSVLSTVMTLVLGLIVFGEKINAWNGAGLVFALIALVLLQV